MNEKRFHNILLELIDENPFAIRAMLRILKVEFSDKIQTLAVTMEERPRLLVNIEFISEHCQTEKQVKAVIIHEFLHVLLRHTEDKRRMTALRNLAFDAVINAIIHRQYGPGYSDMMASYYADATNLQKLLRPMNSQERRKVDGSWWFLKSAEPWVQAWDALYRGKLVADDIEALAEQIATKPAREYTPDEVFTLSGEAIANTDDLLGNHDDFGSGMPEKLADVLDRIMQEMNGEGIWREPNSRGVGSNPYQALFTGKSEPMQKWERKTLQVLKRYLQPDRKSPREMEVQIDYRLPVLSTADRRAFVQSLWAPFLPESSWTTQIFKPGGSAQVYLDVSGSMSAEMALIINLLGRLSKYIQRPFWAFSDEVAPATIENGQLVTVTSGGTSMSCVLEHIIATGPAAAIVVTDGYIETVNPQLLQAAASTRIHAIITRDGSPAALYRAGISYTQLDEVPS